MTQHELKANEPSPWRWALKVGGMAGITGILCCIVPMVLFMLGLAGGVWAISFADFFYGGTGMAGAWILRSLAIAVGIGGILYYRRRQNQCSLDPRRKRRNLILAIVAMALIGGALFVTLDKLSGWYFATHIVPAQQAELQAAAK